MKKLIIGSLLAAIAIFFWGAIFWTKPLPYSYLERPADDATAGKALLDILPKSGTYVVPHPSNPPDTMTKLSLNGPTATIYFQREGRAPMEAKVFVMGFLHGWLTVLLIGVLLTVAVPNLRTYAARVRFVFLAALTMAIFAHGGEIIWWHHPWKWHLIIALYDLSAWLIAGLILAAFVKPPSVGAAMAREETTSSRLREPDLRT